MSTDQILCNDIIGVVIGFCNLQTLLTWRRVNKACKASTGNIIPVQREYKLRLVNEHTPYVTVNNNILMLKFMGEDNEIECELKREDDNLIIYEDALRTLYFHPEILMPNVDQSNAKKYVNLLLIMMLECCEVVLKPEHLHGCHDCRKLYTNVYLVTQIGRENEDTLRCSSCVKTTKLVCGKCRRKIYTENYKFMIRMIKNYDENISPDALLKVIQCLCEPEGRLIEFIQCHCIHEHSHTLAFIPTDEY